ncbi:MAG: hypothetical protein Q8N89_09925 [Azonexus sp.]|nr:hypothetical protein [Azonexus sp.]
MTFVIERLQLFYVFDKTLPEFSEWLHALKDKPMLIRLVRRLEKVQRGNLGDVKAVGHGVFEMREHFGPDWRMYYVLRGTVLIVMLGGDDQGVMVMTKKIDLAGLPEFDLAEYLDSEAVISECLNQTIADGDMAELAHTLGVGRALVA